MKNKVSNGITVSYSAIHLLFRGGMDFYEQVDKKLIEEIIEFGVQNVFEDTEGCTKEELDKINQEIRNIPEVFMKYTSIDGENITVEDTSDVNMVAFNVPVYVDLHGFFIDRIGRI